MTSSRLSRTRSPPASIPGQSFFASRNFFVPALWGGLVWLALGCQPGAPTASKGATDSASARCSQLHRDVAKWQGTEIADCGPDVTALIKLTPIGNDWLLARRPFSPHDDLWKLTPDGVVGAPPIPSQLTGTDTAGFTLLPGSPPTVLAYDPRLSRWNLYVTQASASTGIVLASAGEGQWPPGYWPKNTDGGPWNQQFIGLEDGHLLDRDLGDGSTRIWTVAAGGDITKPTQLLASETLVGGPQDHFRRGHRLVHLGPNLLLEWLPRPCAGRSSPSDPCAGADFNVWSYSLGSGAFHPQIVSSGFWADIGDESDLVADDKHLFVWTRLTGRLRTHALDPTLADPLGQPPIAELPPNPSLASGDWDPPTAAPAIKHIVLVLQDGRSFDSYFGRYCQGLAPAGAPLSCTAGAECCETIPAALPGTASCVDPAAAPDYRPVYTADCMRLKMDGGAMDGFALPHPPDACGDPRDVACAPAVPGDAVTPYHQMASRGALADRFFQTYAFVDGAQTATAPDASIENLLYLVSSRFAGFPPSLVDTPLLTKELVRLEVAWAVYAGPVNLPLLSAFGVPIYYDPDWFPYRDLSRGELEHDITVGALPSVAVVFPDSGDPLRSEAPGLPIGPGIAYVQTLVDAIARSPYQNDTLVVITYLTAGGFYDHVPPPAPPPLDVDSSDDSAVGATAVHYGPRVPLLAVGRFARNNTLSHVQLEVSSITKFIEWNWLHGSGLKGSRQQNDHRRYRDTAVNNLGSLIDPYSAGIDVPGGPS